MSSKPSRRTRNPGRARRRSRRIVMGALVLVLLPFGVIGWSFAPYIRNSEGEPLEVLMAQWGRDHQLGWLVAQAENVYYDHVDVTPTGGEPTEPTVIDGAVAAPTPIGPVVPSTSPSPSVTKPSSKSSSKPSSKPSSRPSAAPSAEKPEARAAAPSTDPPPDRLKPPPRVHSPVGNPLPQEGVWQPVGATIRGVPAIYATRVRADDVHTSVLASMMWIDTSLAEALLVPGYQEPGGPSPSDGALPEQLRPRILANFNGAFRLQDSQGGYFYEGRTVQPLSRGAASAVLHRNGSIDIGSWGRDVKMFSDVVAVRQNLQLIVDGGRSKVEDKFSWGATTHGENFAWRSAIGQRADGSIVYIGSPGLSASGMADTLVRAGVRRAMVLDMNNWWVAGFYFGRDADGEPVCHKLDRAIEEGCDRFLQRYKRDSFQFVSKNPVDR